MDRNELLGRYFYKEDVQDILDDFNLPVSGNKEDLIPRLLSGTSITFAELVDMLNKDTLKSICEDYDLPVGGNVDDLKERVMKLNDEGMAAPKQPNAPTNYPQQYQPPPQYQQPPPPQNQPSSPPPMYNSPDLFNAVIQAIHSWIPGRRYPKEDGYQADLWGVLKGMGFDAMQEMGENQVDILVNRAIPIELKKNPTQSEYHRLYGQIAWMYRSYHCIIAVICDVQRLDQFDDFMYHIQHDFPNGDVIVIKK